MQNNRSTIHSILTEQMQKDTMSRLFTTESESENWKDACRQAIVEFGASESDIIRVRNHSETDGDEIAIVHNGELESITLERSMGMIVHLERKYTDRYSNALKHFENVSLQLRAARKDVSIFVHPSDKGLVEYVNPVDTRMYQYSIGWSSIMGDSVSCRPLIECNTHDYVDNAHGVISIPRDITLQNGQTEYHSPEFIAQEIDNDLQEKMVPKTEIVRVYNTLDVFDQHTHHIRNIETIITLDGKRFEAKGGNCIVYKMSVNVSDLEEEILALDDRYGEDHTFQAIPGTGMYFFFHQQTDTYEPRYRGVTDITPFATMKRICDFSIAMASLDLPIYVILWIIDFLPGTQFVAHIKKLRYIEALKKSIQKVFDARTSNKNQRLIEAS